MFIYAKNNLFNKLPGIYSMNASHISRRALLRGLGVTAALSFAGKTLPVRLLTNSKTAVLPGKIKLNSRYAGLKPGVNGVKRINFKSFTRDMGFRPVSPEGRQRIILAQSRQSLFG